MTSQFIYIPGHDGFDPFWINLAQVRYITHHESGHASVYFDEDPDGLYLYPNQAEVLIGALSPSPKLPELPKFEAAARFDSRLERRGRLNDGISDAEYFDRYTEADNA